MWVSVTVFWVLFSPFWVLFAVRKVATHHRLPRTRVKVTSADFPVATRYTEERVDWSQIEWKDNQVVIDALEKRPLGVFCILDSECIMPRATDESCASARRTGEQEAR